jgi:hypothetical protein
VGSDRVASEERTEQISLRVSAEEKLGLETLKRQQGFKGSPTT